MKIINIRIYKFKQIFNLYSIILAILCILILMVMGKHISINNNILFEQNKEEYSEDKKNIENLKTIQENYNNNKLICLTFDDGPSKYTKLLIDGLKERNVKATFFVLGKNISNYPDYIKESYQNGNEIAIHGYSHKIFTKISDDKVLDEIYMSNNELLKIINKTSNLIRVPCGSINNRVKKVLEDAGMTNILWTIDSKDWRFLNTTKDYNYVLKKVTGNDIILMHDTYKPSVLAALQIVDKLKSEGYMFVTVSEYLACIYQEN